MMRENSLLTSYDQSRTQKFGIQEAAKFVDLKRLCLSPQCGFSSSVEGVMSEDQEHAKPAGLIEVANDIWGNI